MPQKIRMWEVTNNNSLTELPSSEINFEDRLEAWLESDISALDENLLVIGRQVKTGFNKEIDLLCLDNSGNTVVVELKKGATKPREIVSQVLDYVSWTKDLRLQEIRAIAAQYSNLERPLEIEFQEKFDHPLPDEPNLSHSSLIVAEKIDADTERMVRYLADFGVRINVATVQHFKDLSGRELLAQIYLIEPEEVDSKGPPGPKGDRVLPNSAQMVGLAYEKGVGDLYVHLTEVVSGTLNGASFGKESRGFRVKNPEVNDRVNWLAVFVVELGESNKEAGLVIRLNGTRLMRIFDLNDEQFRRILPPRIVDLDASSWQKATQDEIANWKGYRCYFRSEGEVDKFIAGLRASVG